MEKAYDRVEWNFLRHCLQSMGFHPTWAKWIQDCVTTVSYSLIINNKSFKPTWELPQGDPCSPYLFILCMDIMAWQLFCQTLQPKSGIGFKLAACTEKIQCLLFADDSLHFCKASSQAAFNLKNIVDAFCQQSGKLINFHKSSVVFSKNS